MSCHMRRFYVSFCYSAKKINVVNTFSRFATTNTTEANDPGIKIKTQFGYQKIDSENKQEKVNDVFHNVAKDYDIMNDLMSFGVHRIWKDQFMEMLHPSLDTKLLDVAGGTGDIAFRFLKYVDVARKKLQFIEDSSKNEGCTVTVCDINPAMLDVGKQRAETLSAANRISWVVGNAEKLPFESESFSAYTIAFGIRNVTNINKVLTEAYRVLQPGGRFLCLEFSHVTNEPLRNIYDRYSMDVIPVMGYLVAGQWTAYQYLVESIRNFPDQESFKDMIQRAGFRGVTYTNLTWGVVAIHSGFKL